MTAEGLEEFNISDGIEMLGNAAADHESTEQITPAAFRARAKARMINAARKDTLSNLINCLPEDNEYIHIISNGNYDAYSFVLIFADLLQHIDELWASTWTMNRANVDNLFALHDAGKIDQINIITGLYFRRRETSVYATLVEGLIKRGGKYCACENHAKVLLVRSGNKHYVVEGSANWTSNPRIEQNLVTCSTDLWTHHRSWMQTYIKR